MGAEAAQLQVWCCFRSAALPRCRDAERRSWLSPSKAVWTGGESLRKQPHPLRGCQMGGTEIRPDVCGDSTRAELYPDCPSPSFPLASGRFHLLLIQRAAQQVRQTRRQHAAHERSQQVRPGHQHRAAEQGTGQRAGGIQRRWRTRCPPWTGTAPGFWQSPAPPERRPRPYAWPSPGSPASGARCSPPPGRTHPMVVPACVPWAAAHRPPPATRRCTRPATARPDSRAPAPTESCPAGRKPASRQD